MRIQKLEFRHTIDGVDYLLRLDPLALTCFRWNDRIKVFQEEWVLTVEESIKELTVGAPLMAGRKEKIGVLLRILVDAVFKEAKV